MAGFSRRDFIGGVAGGAAVAVGVSGIARADGDAGGGPLLPVRLTTEHVVNPLGIDAARPRFGWQLVAGGDHRRQTAYRIVVATTSAQASRGQHDVWDSGRVASREQSARVYAGPSLNSRTRYHWAVRVWDENGEPGPWSDAAWFETAMLADDDWSAAWIGSGLDVAHPTRTLEPGQYIWAQLEPEKTLGQTFASATPLVAVAVLLNGPREGISACTLTLRRGDPEGDVIASEVVSGLTGETQGTLDLPEQAAPGDYYVEISAPDGEVYWQTAAPDDGRDVYDGGAAFRDGDILEKADRWVYGIPPDPPADPLLRREFHLPGAVASARLYVAGLGLAESWVNGSRVGEAEVSPPPTDYDLRSLYTTHDVTSMLREGSNTIGVALGRGFYATRAPDSDGSNLQRWVAEPRLKAQLEVTLTNGRRVIVGTGPDWQLTEGPTVYDGVYTGETHDARVAQRLDGWTTPEFDAGQWREAAVVDGPGGRLEAHALDSVRMIDEVRPVTVTEPGDGVRLYDFGVVLAGWVRLRGRFAEGATVRVLYSEKLGATGRIEVGAPGGVDNPSVVGRFNVDEYIALGRGTETWKPSFTYKGFRYVEITGTTGSVEVVAETVHSDLTHTMDLRLDDPDLQWIADAFHQTAFNGLHGYPDNAPMYTKFGWTSSTYRATAPMLYQFGMAGLFGKWLDDIRLSQAPSGEITLLAPFGAPTNGWLLTPSSTGVYPHLVRRYWLTYGDATIPERHFEAVHRYIDWLIEQIGDGVADDRFGDWYPPQPDRAPGEGANPFAPEGGTLVGTAYAIQSLRDATALAELVGADAQALEWQETTDRLVERFTAEFLDQDAGLYRTAVTEAGYRQTSNAVPLAFGLVPGEHVDAVAGRLAAEVEAKDRHLDTGALGTGALPFALSDHGHGDLAHAVLNRRTYPSYGYLRELGATTFWESWEADSRGHNDATLSLVVQWLVERAAGVEPLEPGWARFRVTPGVVGTLPGASVRLDTVRGRVGVAWRRRGNGLVLDLRVPVNAVAEVVLPNGDVNELGSGRHRLNASPR